MFTDKLDWNLDRTRSKDIWSHVTDAETRAVAPMEKEEEEEDQELSQFYGNSQ
jgi:hypothetical protein